MQNPETPPGGWALLWVAVFGLAWLLLAVVYFVVTAAV